MRIAIIISSFLLWLWFLGCTTTWRFGKILLVEGMGTKSIEFVALVLFSIGIVVFLLWEPIGKWVLLVELALWLIEQFFCHEYFTIFGANKTKWKGYHKCFEGTIKLFPVTTCSRPLSYYPAFTDCHGLAFCNIGSVELNI